VIAPPPTTRDVYLHGSGATANPPTLFLDATAPSGATARYKDSPGVKFSGGNVWQPVGVWTAGPGLMAGRLMNLGDLHVWLGLKNSDDIGTRFDLRAEVYRNGVLVATGETDCITGVTRNAAQAKEAGPQFPHTKKRTKRLPRPLFLSVRLLHPLTSPLRQSA
jgi:hypothetical protein